MNNFRTFISGIRFTAVAIFLFGGCVKNTGPDEASKQPDSVSRMVKINSKGAAFYLGASDVLAGSDEKPPLKNYFTYSFFMDTAEVTQKIYADIMGSLPDHDFTKFGKGDAYPVYYVSWFDAVLFCNARSRAEHLDTVYSWSGPPLKEKGSVYNLTGLTIHYDRDGYRLPTEAEWEYAARAGSSAIPFPGLTDSAEAGRYAWYSGNALGQTHPIASKKANLLGLYDMAGNVFEWTGDWKGFYNGDSIVNSIGTQFHNGQYERVVKGGAFTHGLINLRPSRRSATYPTAHAVVAEYIGFRCVRGAVSNVNFIGQGASAKTTNPVTLLVNTLRPTTGSLRSRLAFVNVTRSLRTLCYADFSDASPQIVEFTDSANVHMPVISPDGKYVAYGTSEAGNGNADVFIRNLDEPSKSPVHLPAAKAFCPRWWIDPRSLDTCIIFVSSMDDNALAAWSDQATYRIKFSNGQVSGAAALLTSGGSFNGGISKDGSYALTGFTHLIRRNLGTKEDLHLFVSPENGKPAAGSDQVCNVSVCQGGERPDRCMFIDFGASTGSTLVGTVYGVHQYLFVSDFTGKVSAWYRHPAGELSWDFPEWSNQDGFAVACGTNSADDPHAVYCIDLNDSQYVKLVEGTIIYDPYLWIADKVDTAGGLNPDSLGNYNDPPLYNGQDFFTKRMQSFWFYKDSMQIVAIGSSHLCHAIDPSSMPKNKVYNMAFIDCMYSAMFTILESYLIPNCPRLKFLIIDLFLGGMNYPISWHENWNSGVFNGKGFVYDKQHDFWKSGLPHGFLPIMASAPGPDLPMDTLGVYHMPSNGWGGDAPSTTYAQDWQVDSYNHVQNLELFKTNIQRCAQLGIQCLVVITPESPAFHNTGFFMRYGPTWDNGVAMVKQIKAMVDSLPNGHFYDAYNEGNHDYTDDDAYDCDHLSETGARKFSARLDSVLTTIRK